MCVCPQVVLWMSFKKWLFYMICHGICSNKSFFYHVATGRCLSPWTHFSSGGVWGGRGPPATGRFMPGSPFLVCCCCCEVASVVSDSVRPHRRQPTRPPPSLGFSRQEHWSGLPFPSFLVWKSCFNLPSQAHCRTDTLPPEGDLGKKAKLGNVCGLLWKKTLFKPCSDAASKSTLHSGPCRSRSSGGTQALGAGRLLLPVRPPPQGSEGPLTLRADPPAQE